eukprot:448930-Prorocentrum_minimum.AAC.3
MDNGYHKNGNATQRASLSGPSASSNVGPHANHLGAPFFDAAQSAPQSTGAWHHLESCWGSPSQSTGAWHRLESCWGSPSQSGQAVAADAGCNRQLSLDEALVAWPVREREGASGGGGEG